MLDQEGSFPLPENEEERLSALSDLQILYTPAEDRFDRITRLATRLLDVPMALISLVGEECQWFKSVTGLAESETPRAVSFCTHAILKDEAMVIPDATQDPRFVNNPLVTGEPHIRFYAGQPVVANGEERLGTLCVLDRRPRQMGPQELEILRDLAGWCSNELRLSSMSRVQWELIHERDELRRKAMIDPLTQGWNRSAILEVLKRELERTRRAQGWMTLVFADIDRFKEVNDGHGHQVGDEVLRAVASRIRSALRPYDAIGRYGGDEFLVVIAECEDFVAQRVADRICQRVAEKPINTSEGAVTVTLSAGITSVHCPDPAQAVTLINQADRALYLAKEGGRNRAELSLHSDREWSGPGMEN